MISRRQLLQSFAALAATAPFHGLLAAASGAAIRRPVPSSGELLPVVGMGSSRTFDVRLDAASRATLGEVLQIFFDQGGSVIDTSPMYGSAESVLGELLAQARAERPLFAATKVWTRGREAGVVQMQRSAQRMGVARLDLIQIHNLVDWRTHVRTLKDWKAAGKVRYIGITTSHNRDHEGLEQALRSEPFDFVQLSYNIANRVSEQRLLPLAQDRGIAVLVNRPFQRGYLFQRVRGRALPDWAEEFDCASWGQFFLKFVLSHPAVTCAIPATSKPRHMRDNMAAGFGRLPDAVLRRRMIEWLQT